MDIASICRRHVITVDRGATLQQAAALMREHHVGALVVTEHADEGLRIAGVISDRDLAIEVLARGLDAARLDVGRLAASTGARVVSVPGSAGFDEAIQAMQAQGVRRLLVRDDAGHLVGLVSFDDLFEACAAQMAGLAAALRKGLEREAAERASVAAPPLPRLRVPAVGTAGWQSGRPQG